MKTFVNFWQFITESFLEWEMFQTKIAEETKTQILCKYLFFSFENLSVLLDNVKNIYKAGHAMDINMAHALSIWIPKTTNTHSEYVILLVFPPL